MQQLTLDLFDDSHAPSWDDHKRGAVMYQKVGRCKKSCSWRLEGKRICSLNCNALGGETCIETYHYWKADVDGVCADCAEMVPSDGGKYRYAECPLWPWPYSRIESPEWMACERFRRATPCASTQDIQTLGKPHKRALDGE